MKHVDGISRGGILLIGGPCEHPDRVRYRGFKAATAAILFPHQFCFDRRRGEVHVRGHHNAYVRSGLRNSALREWNIGGGGTAITGIGVGSNTTAVTVNTRFGNGASAGLNGAVSGQNVSIKTISPTATIVTDGSSVAQVVTGGVTWTEADFFNSIPFIWNKLFLTLAVPASNAVEVDGNLVDVIGGTGGASPYNRSFSMDFSNAGSFSQTGQIAVTYTAA